MRYYDTFIDLTINVVSYKWINKAIEELTPVKNISPDLCSALYIAGLKPGFETQMGLMSQIYEIAIDARVYRINSYM